MGKHARGSRAGGWIFRGLVLVLALSLVGVAGWYVWTARDQTGPDRCPSTLRVVTTSTFVSVVDAAGQTLRSGHDCVQVAVKVAEGRSAVGQVTLPDTDVWIPDDAAWTAIVKANVLAVAGIASSGTVLATSPIYMVTSAQTATRIRAAGDSWAALANLLNTQSGVRLVVSDPSGSGDGMVGAGSVGEAVWLTKGMDASSLSLANALRVTRTVNTGLAAMPDNAAEVGLVPEYALLPSLDQAPPDRTYLSGSDHTALMRVTWLPTATAANDPKRSAALGRLLAAFRGSAVATALRTAGFRGPDNVRPAVRGAERLPTVTAKPFDVLQAHHVEHVFATWDPADRRSNVLIVIDVSSMAASSAPPARGLSTVDLLRDGCRQVAELLPDGSRLGVWEFGADPSGKRKVLVPTARLDSDQRAMMVKAVGELTSRRPGGGLYDTIVDAFTFVRDDYQPDMVNQVIVFTDDQHGDSADSPAVASLVSRLGAARDPERPVQLSVVVLGPSAAADRLKNPFKPIDAYVEAAKSQDDIFAAFIHVTAGGLHE